MKPLDFVRPKIDLSIENIRRKSINTSYIRNNKVYYYGINMSNKMAKRVEKVVRHEMIKQKCALGIIVETNGKTASVRWIGDSFRLKYAWWNIEELEVVDNLPSLLANEMAHPFGTNTEQGKLFFK